jgi:hypothetical protein
LGVFAFVKDKGAIPHPVGSEVFLKMGEVIRLRCFQSVHQFTLQGVTFHITLLVQ